MSKRSLVLLISFVFVAALRMGKGVNLVANASVLDSLKSFLGELPNIRTNTTEETQGRISEESTKEPTPLYKPALDYESAVMSGVEQAAPSVVSIVVSKDLPVIERCPSSPFGGIPPELRDFFGGGFGGLDFSEPCEKGIKHQEVGGGTGFIVSEDGLIVTNKHVVSDEKADYTVLTNDGKKYDAKVLARDPVQDIAIMKASGSGFKPAKIGDSSTLKLGQTAIAIGNSLGEFRNTVSVGVVSGLARTIVAGNRGASETIQGVIQTDAAINPGNSGGPLLNLRGEVIGISTAIVSGAQNIGFAIPINQAKRDIESVKKTGDIKASYLGVRYLLINADIKEKQKLDVDYGALIRGTEDGPAIVPGSPAAKAGLQAEDIILEVNGEKVTIENPLAVLVQKYNIGDSIKMKVLRGEESLTLSVVLVERPKN